LNDIAYSDLIEKKAPILIETVQQMANPAIRAMATIGGNLCSASPSADMAPPLMGLGAIVKIMGPIGDRTLPVEEFFKGPGENALKRGEILVEIQVPLVPPRTGSAYIKMPARTAVGLALVGVAVVVTLDGECDRVGDVKIFLGAVAPTPLRARRAESLMKGRVIEDDLLGQVSRAAAQEARPLADVRGSAEYRREMVRVLTRRAVSRALKTAKERQRTS
jgi:carbon-monoxide dehydrogenase medium subunit